MPNTLAHAGVQGLLSRFGIRGADLKWIYLGCVIPDVPWILQRIAWLAIPGIDPFALRAYVVVQASIFSCLILCATVAAVVESPWRTFGILGLNAVLHLLLDAVQTKWANGVHFLAPFSWELTNWGLFWPESGITYVLTGLGLVYIVVYWRRSTNAEVKVKLSARRFTAAGALAIAYVVLPCLLIQKPVEANNHYLRTLAAESRSGQYVEFDRVGYVSTPQGGALEYWGRERLFVEVLDVEAPATVSVRGVFTAEHRIRTIDYHVHADGLRDAASYLGLTLIMVIWIVAWRRNASSSVARR